MKTSLIVATVVASLVALSIVPQLGAQNGMPPRASANPGHGAMPVALIDIGYIFKNNIRFKNAMDVLGKDIRATEDVLNKERMVIQKMMERLKDYKPSTPDFKHLEEDIAQKQADFQVKAQIQKREFQEREAALYFKTIQEINDAVKLYAESNQIGLVMKFNGDPIDSADRESVMRELNKPVMYYNRGIDITPFILTELNRGAVPNPGADTVRGGGGTGGGTRAPGGYAPQQPRMSTPPGNQPLQR